VITLQEDSSIARAYCRLLLLIPHGANKPDPGHLGGLDQGLHMLRCVPPFLSFPASSHRHQRTAHVVRPAAREPSTHGCKPCASMATPFACQGWLAATLWPCWVRRLIGPAWRAECRRCWMTP